MKSDLQDSVSLSKVDIRFPLESKLEHKSTNNIKSLRLSERIQRYKWQLDTSFPLSDLNTVSSKILLSKAGLPNLHQASPEIILFSE